MAKFSSLLIDFDPKMLEHQIVWLGESVRILSSQELGVVYYWLKPISANHEYTGSHHS